MRYAIGIDVGTTYTAAAICRVDGQILATPEAIGLGTRSTATASVVYIGDDGQWLVGDAADRRANDRPDLVLREFKRRLGDPIPAVIGGQRHKPEAISAHVVRWVVDRVAEQEGSAAAAIAVTHPASWGAYKRSLIQNAIESVELSEVSFLSEPVAAATHYAAQARVGIGSTIAVYDLGGGTFDAAVVRKLDEQTFELLGTPQGIDRLGGLDFDEAVFSHLRGGVSLPPVDPADVDAVAAMARLRRECTEAKEALSADTDATIPVLLPDLHTRVRLVRAEFEDLIHDAVESTVDALRVTIDSAGVTLGEIDAVLLVGGSSRIPLVAQLVSQRLERPVVVDADPKATIALGAAHVAATRIEAGAGRRAPAVAALFGTTAQSTPIASVTRRRHRRMGAGALGVGVAVVAGAAVAIVWPQDSNTRPRIVALGDSVAEAAGSDEASAAGSATTGQLPQAAGRPAVPGSSVLIPITLTPPAPAVDPASSVDETAPTAAIPFAGSLVTAQDSSAEPSNSRTSGSTSSKPRPSSSAAASNGGISGPGGTTEPLDSTSIALTAADPETATSSEPTWPATTPPPTEPPDTTPPADPPDTSPPPTDPPDTTPPTDPPDTSPPPTDPPDTTPLDTEPEQTDPPDTEPQQVNPPTESGVGQIIADESSSPADSDPV